MTTTADVVANDSSHPFNVTATQQENLAEPGLMSGLVEGGYPKWIGQKFKPNGTVLPFAGNTILCHLSPNSDLYNGLLGLYDDLQRQSFASLYVLLPPSSWHMTLSEGVCDQLREVNSWPTELPLNASLQTCNNFMKQKLADFSLTCDPPFQMAFTGWEPLEDGIALTVVPATDAEETRLRGLRDRLAEQLGLRHPGHDEYVFHISMAYTLRYLSQDEIETTLNFLEAWRARLPGFFELGAPEFCVFEDMFAFRRESYLGETTKPTESSS